MTANTKHEVVERFQPSDGSMKIWRYIDLPKLIAFLETKSLHFARADTLGDAYEGSWTSLNVKARAQQIQEITSDAKVTQPPEAILQTFKSSTYMGRETTYINCWLSTPLKS